MEAAEVAGGIVRYGGVGKAVESCLALEFLVKLRFLLLLPPGRQLDSLGISLALVWREMAWKSRQRGVG